MKHKILKTFICFLYLLVLSTSALAHKVNVYAYAENDTVYTESYFPDGKKVKGGKIEVYDSDGNRLLCGVTDNNGRFNFKIPKRDNMKIVLNASMGHRSSSILSRDELPELADGTVGGAPETGDGITHVETGQIMKKLSKLEEKRISLTEVVGGLGYIFGIAGITFYFMSKRKRT